MHTRLLAAFLLTAGLLSAPAHATTPYPNQSTLWSRDQTNFGAAVAIAPVSGDTIAVFDNAFTSPVIASVFVFQFTNGVWTEVARLTPDNEGPLGGAIPSVAVSDNGDFIALALPSVIDVFQKPAGGWKDMAETAQLSVASSTFSEFTTYMGANATDIAAVFDQTGTADSEIAVFTKPALGWATTSSPDAILTETSNGPFATEDISMAVTDGLIAIPAGSPSHDVAYIYDKPAPPGWANNVPNKALITSPDITGIALSGSTLALSSDSSIEVFQGPTWGAAIATLSSTTTVPLPLDNLIAESPNLIVAGSTANGTIFGYQKPVSAWADATDADFSIAQSSRVVALAATDSTIVVSTGNQTCPVGLPGTEGIVGTTLLCPLVYVYDSGAITTQVADLLDSVAVSGGKTVAFIGKPFSANFSIANEGNAAADNVQAVIALPSLITGVSATVSQGSCVNQTTQLVCNLGSIAAAASATVTISATAPAKGPSVTHSVTVTTSSPERSIRDGARPVTYRVDAPPIANPFSLTMSAAGFDYLGAFQARDADHDHLTYRIVTQPKHAKVSITTSGTGAEGYSAVTDSTGYLGPDSFTYTANDGFTDSNTAEVNINFVALPPGSGSHKPPPEVQLKNKAEAAGYGLLLDLFLASLLALRWRGLLPRPSRALR